MLQERQPLRRKSEKELKNHQFSFDKSGFKAENRAQHLASKVFRSRRRYRGIQFVLPLS
jgi:hypothetical protein